MINYYIYQFCRAWWTSIPSW